MRHPWPPPPSWNCSRKLFAWVSQTESKLLVTYCPHLLPRSGHGRERHWVQRIKAKWVPQLLTRLWSQSLHFPVLGLWHGSSSSSPHWGISLGTWELLPDPHQIWCLHVPHWGLECRFAQLSPAQLGLPPGLGKSALKSPSVGDGSTRSDAILFLCLKVLLESSLRLQKHAYSSYIWQMCRQSLRSNDELILASSDNSCLWQLFLCCLPNGSFFIHYSIFIDYNSALRESYILSQFIIFLPLWIYEYCLLLVIFHCHHYYVVQIIQNFTIIVYLK